jgi:hypothetical protein
MGRGEACTGFWRGNLRKKDNLGDPGVNGGIRVRCIFKSEMWGMDWTELAQNRDRWRAPVNAVMNFRVP